MELKLVKWHMYPTIRQIYLASFPRAERMPLPILWCRARAKSTWADFFALYEAEQFVGFTYLIHEGNMTVIQYLVIDAAQRGKGYGSAALQLIKQRYQHQTLVLEIEHVTPLAADYDMRLKRQQFYECNGFELADYCSYYYVLFDLMFIGEHLDIERYVSITHRFLLKLLKPKMTLRAEQLKIEQERK